jgi:DNA-binding transcriptional LysR family regulator
MAPGLLAAMRPVNFRTLDLNLLKVFDAVMQERHVTRAAERLAITQPAASNALRRLRESTQQELFVPTSTGVMPTPEALALWPAVHEALSHLQQALAPEHFDVQHHERTFSLAMADATAALFVPALAASLKRQQATVNLRFVALASRDPRALLEQGHADVAVGYFPDVRAALAAEGATRVMTLELLYACEYVSVMRQDHPLAAPGALTLAAYCAAQHLRVSFAGRPHGYVDEALARQGLSRRVAITINHFVAAGAALCQSDLITVLPRSFVPATGLAEALAVRPLPLAMPTIEVGLLWHRRHQHDAGHRWLRQTLNEAARALAPTRGST